MYIRRTKRRDLRRIVVVNGNHGLCLANDSASEMLAGGGKAQLLGDETVSALRELAEVLRQLHEQFLADGLNLLDDGGLISSSNGDGEQ